MRINNIRFIERLAFRSELSLRDVCAALSAGMTLPAFQYHLEASGSESGHIHVQHFELQVYPIQELNLWDRLTPEGYNYGILLVVLDDAPVAWNVGWSFTDLLPFYGQVIADLLGSEVAHHATWSEGKFLSRNVTLYHSRML